MAESVELKACPFCGGEAEIWRANQDFKRKAWIACMGRCAVLTREHLTDAEAIEAWNRRVSAAPSEGGERGKRSSRERDEDLCADGSLPVLTADAACPALRELDPKSWEVEVRIDGERVLTIGHGHLSGIPDIDKYGDTVRTCAEHLQNFIGTGEPAPCFYCRGEEGEYACPICTAPAESAPTTQEAGHE